MTSQVSSVCRIRATIEQARGRPLLLVAAELPSGHSSLWVATDDIDLIVYTHDADQAEQLRAIAHQAGHILLGHRAAASDATTHLFPHLAPDVAVGSIEIVLFSEPDELDADSFAAKIAGSTGLSENTRGPALPDM
jgi:hypothetical protein